MSAIPSRQVAIDNLERRHIGTRGFLHIVRHGSGSRVMYVMTYHRLSSSESASRPHPVLAEGAQSLIEMLEQLGLDFRQSEVRGAMTDILRFGSANIPDLWLCSQELVARGLIES